MSPKETLSTSVPTKNVNPKFALEAKYKEQTQKLPKPTGWRIIVLPFKMGEKTKGGVVLHEAALERQQVASQCGLVLQWDPNVIGIKNAILMVHGVRSTIGLFLQGTQDRVFILKVVRFVFLMKMKFWQPCRIQRIYCMHFNIGGNYA